jgi:hypothetical protein
VFVAYPYRFGVAYRRALNERFKGTDVEFRYADDNIMNAHVMDKIRRMMREADVSFFDVTGANPNVMLELGFAMGGDEPGFVGVQRDAVDAMNADILGWDTLRYDDFPDLANKLFEYIMNRRVPARPPTQHIAIAQVSVRDRLREMRFGIPAVSEPLLMVFETPSTYERYAKQRALLGEPPYRAQDLCGSVIAAKNRTRHETFFWPMGFDYEARPGPDFVEVYEGRSSPSQTERITNFRMYLSGAATYMQRLRVGGADGKPFLYLYMFQNIMETALIAFADARANWGFDVRESLDVGALFLHASDLHVSRATPEFYPQDDAGRPVLDGAELWVPDQPISVPGADLELRAKELANEMMADLETKIL